MRRPPFKLDGRYGQMRWRHVSGDQRTTSGRLAFLARRWAELKLAGVGGHFEMRLGPEHPWHRCEATDLELRASLTGLGGMGIYARATRMRAARESAGKPVYPDDGDL